MTAPAPYEPAGGGVDHYTEQPTDTALRTLIRTVSVSLSESLTNTADTGEQERLANQLKQFIKLELAIREDHRKDVRERRIARDQRRRIQLDERAARTAEAQTLTATMDVIQRTARDLTPSVASRLRHAVEDLGEDHRRLPCDGECADCGYPCIGAPDGW